MMYTPTPSARRPRPPSRSRTALLPKSTTGDMPPAQSLSMSMGDNTPLTAQIKRRKELARSTLARVSASPDVGDVSIDLDIKNKDIRETGSRSKQRGVGLGLPSPLVNRSPINPPEAEPSPPPPYGLGQDLPEGSSGDIDASEPLRQDSGSPSRHSSVSMQETIVDQIKLEERLRARRATDAARAMGLEVDFGTSGSEHWSMESEDDLSESTLRARLLEMRRQLKRRDNELILAAEVANRALETHENLLAHLPSNVKARLPDIAKLFANHPERQTGRGRSSSPSPPRQQVSLSQYSSHSDSSSEIVTSQPRYGRGQTKTMYGEYGHTTDTQDDFITADDELGPSHASHPKQFLTQKHTRVSRPKHTSHPSASSRYVPSPRQARMSALQQAETDERILALEQALNDAKESEENQRKLAARLRKEVDKLHRDFERAEEEMEMQQARPQGLVGTPGHRAVPGNTTWKGQKPARAGSTRKSRIQGEADQRLVSWGATVFPQFPPGSTKADKKLRRVQQQESDVAEVDRDLLIVSAKRQSREERHSSVSPAPSLPSSRSNSKFLEVHTPAKNTKAEKDSTIRLTPTSHRNPHSASTHRKSADDLTLFGDHRRVRKKISHSNFLAPETDTPDHQARSTSPAPRLTVEAPETSSEHSNSDASRASSRIGRSVSNASVRTMRRSPWPSPHGSTKSSVSRISPNPRAHLEFTGRQGSLSPAFASLSSRMASMRAFVSSALNASPSEVGRTLGSELGSEYGDRPESSLRVIEDALMLAGVSPSRTNGSDMDGNSVYSDGYCEPPAPLPPRVSAALSSLALALAPYASPNPHATGGPEHYQGYRYARKSPYPQNRDSGESETSSGSESSSRDRNMNLFDVAFGSQKIRWADSTDSQPDSTSTTPDDEAGNTSNSAANQSVNAGSVFSETRSRSDRSDRSDKPTNLKLRLPSPRARPRARPAYLRYSSDGSVALAHRRRPSLHYPNPAPVKSHDYMTKQDEEGEEGEDGGVVWEELVTEEMEPQTIPGRLVHDIICLLAMLVDFIECAIVIVYRVIMDLRYNRRGLSGLNRRAKMKRYYL